ncbi:SpaA isopeptide-forming pilin-related protein [Streptomyces smaragdinus]|nr:SpaA isopeptide-forming pilin-related protein [Streptomyces smaragdinus]
MALAGLAVSSLSLPAAARTRGASAAVDCVPQPGYTDCVRFTYSGGDQMFSVPPNVRSLHVQAWGAGGGGQGGPTPDIAFKGAGGGYTQGDVAVEPGEQLTVTAGQGGRWASQEATYGGGGPGGVTEEFNIFGSASGGGMSALWRGDFVATPLVIAGGGGGAGAYSGLNVDLAAGGGGGTSGTEGSASHAGKAGTQTAGGAGGQSCLVPLAGGRETGAATDISARVSPGPPATPGVQFHGGSGQTDPTGHPGGGGGGGFFGGGGGSCDAGGQEDGGGGGGSGFLAEGVSSGVTVAAATSSAVPSPSAGEDRPLYTDGIGNGGGWRANGGNGEVVLQWSETADLTTTKSADDTSPSYGDEVTFTVRLENTGPSDAPDAFVVDRLPAGLTYVSHTGPGTYDPQTGRWEPGGLTAGSTAVLKITARAKELGPLTNTVTASGSGLPDPTPCDAGHPENCGDPVTVTVVLRSHITVKKIDRKNHRPLPGAVFQLWRETNGIKGLQRTGSSPDTREGSACATNGKGICAFTRLDLGVYYLEETDTPEGYVMPKNPVSGPYRLKAHNAAEGVTTVRGNNREGGKGK